MYDLIIIGGGPAGCAAAVYAARKQLKTALITPEFGGQSVVSEKIFNWIGTPEISGSDLAKNLKEHVLSYWGDFLDVFEGQSVRSVTRDEKGAATDSPAGFLVATDAREFSARTVLVTTGSTRRKLAVPGADTYENKGVVYCASCDGPLFAGQGVVVVGGGNAAFETVAQLAAYCPSVTLVHRSDRFRADEVTVAKVREMPAVRIMTFTDPVEVTGEAFVTGIRVRHAETGTEELIPCGGVFVEIGQIPNVDYVKDLVKIDEFGTIVVDPWTQATSVPGIWAAGDCTNIRYHQNNIAAGDAVKAVEDLYLAIKAK